MTLKRDQLEKYDKMEREEALKLITDPRDKDYYNNYRNRLLYRLTELEFKLADRYLADKPGLRKEFYDMYRKIAPQQIYGLPIEVETEELFKTPEEVIETEIRKGVREKYLPPRFEVKPPEPYFMTAERVLLEDIKSDLLKQNVVVYIKTVNAFGKVLHILYVQDHVSNEQIYRRISTEGSYAVFKDVYEKTIKPVLERHGFKSYWLCDYAWTYPLVAFRR
jgi:hypothetical protein